MPQTTTEYCTRCHIQITTDCATCEDAWWRWHDGRDTDGQSRGSSRYADMDEAEAACRAWMAGDPGAEGPDEEEAR